MISIIDYNAGNLTSVKRALDYLGIACEITPDPDRIRKAQRIIFPGVGHAASAMSTLKERGLDVALRDAFAAGIPILGICLGCQIILTSSEEGETTCIGLMEGRTQRFVISDPALKIPHMGWNAVDIVKPHPLLCNLKPADELYFVHSFYPQPIRSETIYARSEYGGSFPAAIGERNLFATQFHPEKSGPLGLAILTNFASWDGTPW